MMSEGTVLQTFAIQSEGVGRRDYGAAIETAVEPMIRSYESEYSYFEAIAVNAGASVQRVLTLPADTVVIVYDFFISCPVFQRIELVFEFYVAPAYTELMRKSDLGSVKIQLSKGFPLFDQYRLTINNLGDVNVTIPLSVHGIETAEDQYYGGVG